MAVRACGDDSGKIPTSREKREKWSTRQGRFDLRKESQKSWEHHVCDKIVYLPQSFAVFADRQRVGMPRVSLPEIYLKADAWIELQFCLVGERNAHYVEIIESLDAKIKRITLRDRAATGLKAKNVSLRDVSET